MGVNFPIDEILPGLLGALHTHRRVVLSAPPGAGKTTRVPIALLGVPWRAGRKVLMLEPRRLAAVRAAQFMASQLGERAGETVGYRIRGETRVSRNTAIEVVTEGILTRMLHENPELPDTGIIVFDEHHERSIHADFGLALALDVQENLRNDVRILVMSATLDGDAVARLLGDAPVIESAGRNFPVVTRYAARARTGSIEPAIVETVLRALANEEGDLLVFLPGQREIRRVEQMLLDKALPSGTSIQTLYGDASLHAQQAALAPAEHDRRKVILSTSIAETSLTIDGVRVVIDSGLARGPHFDPRRGMSGLVTMDVSRATADQRRGRAGRQGPGTCYRLWTEEQHAALPRFPTPEILVADLAPLALDLALWGSPGAEGLRFLDPPPPAHLARATSLLQNLGAMSKEGKLTAHGRAMAALPVHPRLAHMILRANGIGLGALACDLAALLEERDILEEKGVRDVDLAGRWDALRTGRGAERSIRSRATAEARRLRELLGIRDSPGKPDRIGLLVALAYPERIARRRNAKEAKYQMAGGVGAIMPAWSPLTRAEWLAVAEVDGIGTEVRIFLASRVEKSELLELFADDVAIAEEVSWDPQEETVVARRVQKLGALIVGEQSLELHGPRGTGAMLEGVRQMGLGCLPWDKESSALRDRSEWLRIQRLVPDGWPDLGDEHLLSSLSGWLGPVLGGVSRKTHLARLDLASALRALFTRTQLRELDRLAPKTLKAPTGSMITLQYSPASPPVLAVKLQEMFGETRAPTVAGGRVPVVVHLLSPAGRPLAVTQDLPSFWRNSYPEVSKQMRGRYPKHHWPEDPLNAAPTKRVKKNRA